MADVVHAPAADVRSFLPRPTSVLLLAVAFVPGLVFGLDHGMPGCQVGAVEVLKVLPQNLALTLLLASGYFCLGASTVVVALVALGTTGAAVGSIVAELGWQGVLLILPHGLLEAAAVVLATDLGLRSVRARLRRSADPAAGRGTRTARDLVVVVMLISLAALVEAAWTSVFGPSLGCR